MTFKLEFDTGNASFKADRSAAICQILRDVAETIPVRGSEEGVIHDTDGNRIGQYAAHSHRYRVTWVEHHSAVVDAASERDAHTAAAEYADGHSTLDDADEYTCHEEAGA